MDSNENWINVKDLYKNKLDKENLEKEFNSKKTCLITKPHEINIKMKLII